MIDSQLELGFGNAERRARLTQRQKRLGRAKWWFERMRQIVDRAIDWKPALAPRPEQIWLEAINR